MAAEGMSRTAKGLAVTISAGMVIASVVLGVLAGVGTLSGNGSNSDGVVGATQACGPTSTCLQLTSAGETGLPIRE